MKKISILIVLTSVFLRIHNLNAQYGPNATDPEKKTKIVRGCEYEVIPGLAKITAVEITRPANESILEYDEHEVLFMFTPMEGGEVLEILKGAELEFKLRNRAASIPVGPKYIQKKQLKVGTRYAMNLLQTSNKEACLEQFTYESKVLDNDLFEAKDLLIPFIKADYENQLMQKDQADNEQKLGLDTSMTDKLAAGKLLPLQEERVMDLVEELENENVDIVTMTLEEMRIYVAKRLKNQQKDSKGY